jgi:hypothetical protein
MPPAAPDTIATLFSNLPMTMLLRCSVMIRTAG